ncbi:MAG: helical backbone metal receptor [Ilumatobacter fluminis]|uniref:helical backbone metal receptor n=1 Tax=Ilumatobacter fluminis TaxID=467091 RepID=UPI0032EC130B
MRVVSLVPSATETLTAWGVEPVACTRFCERPDLLHVGGTKNPDIDAIVGLAPDLVVVDREENRREDAEALTAAGLELVVLDVRSLDGLHDELSVLAEAVGVSAPDPVADSYPSLDLRAFVPIWRRPWMTIGGDTFGSSMLRRLGVENVFADATDDYPTLELDAAAALAPDVVLVPSEPYVFTDEHLDELASVARPVRVDGQDLFWWGARTADALDRLHRSLRDAAG